MELAFDFKRFALLIRRESALSYKPVLIALGGILGALVLNFISIVMDQYSSPRELSFHEGAYTAFLLIGGFVFSSLAFSSLHHPLRKFGYLLLPASSLEKYLSMLVLTSIGWLLGFTLVYKVFAEVANGITHAITPVTVIPFNPFGETELGGIKIYIIVQAMFLCGAAYFKNYTLFRTLLTLLIVGMLLSFAAYLVFADMIYVGENIQEPNESFKEFVEKDLPEIAEFMFHWVMAPLFWVIGYFAVKEKEV
ncbi:hypothetical protein R9C00_12585 [Flammeovirgaceae bacterium SG7u.111]|nr:hypothetical protein [Flammeovirgaceae bacterium SG7u.132]WPO38290.1 hypothetical protein R9C00_12585 [Flammeovirgaceae bacterium SG7u.111]